MDSIIDYVKFGKLLSDTRKKMNITQAQASEKLDMSTSHYSNLELGKAQCSITMLIKICNLYNLPIETSISNYVPSSISYDLFTNVSKASDETALKITEHLIKILEG